MSAKKLKGQKFPLSEKYNRNFSESFKKAKVKELVEKRLTIKEVCDLYKVSRTSVYNWIHKYSDTPKGIKQVVQMESEAEKTKYLLQQVAELERIVGRKQLEIDYLNKTLEIASTEIGYNIKKKYEQRPSNGLEQTKKP